MSDIVPYMVKGDGTQNVGVRVGGAMVLVQPDSSAQNDDARRLAERIAGVEADRRAMEFQLAAAQNETTALRATIRRLEAKLADAHQINEAALAGRRRFFGPVLMRPVGDDWTGEVWLLDPEKKDRGMGLRFASVAEVRALHPELWVMKVTADGVLLDAWGSP